MAIPKTVYQTARSVSTMSDAMRRNLDANRAMNPGWHFRMFDNDQMLAYLANHLPRDALPLLDRINPHYGVVLADLFRLVVIYHEGGVYLDLKTRLSVPLDQIVRPTDHYIISHWQNKPGQRYHNWGIYPDTARLKGGELQNWHIIAEPNHPFLRRAIEQVLFNMAHYCEHWHGTGKGGILRVSGPIAYTLALGPLLSRYESRFIDAEAAGIHYSCYDDPMAHTREAGHYTQVDEPVMLPAVAQGGAHEVQPKPFPVRV